MAAVGAGVGAGAGVGTTEAASVLPVVEALVMEAGTVPLFRSALTLVASGVGVRRSERHRTVEEHGGKTGNEASYHDERSPCKDRY